MLPLHDNVAPLSSMAGEAVWQWVKEFTAGPGAVQPSVVELCSLAAARAAEAASVSCSCPVTETVGIDGKVALAIAEEIVGKLPGVLSTSGQLVGSEPGRLLLAFLVGVFFWALVDVLCLVRATWTKFVQVIAYTLRTGVPVTSQRAALR